MRITINIAGFIIFILFVFNNQICDYFYDYSVITERMDWINLRFRIYEFAVFVAFGIVSINTNNVFTKMIFSFSSVLMLFSLIDKIVFTLNRYSYTDILACFISLIVSFVVFYKNQNKIV